MRRWTAEIVKLSTCVLIACAASPMHASQAADLPWNEEAQKSIQSCFSPTKKNPCVAGQTGIGYPLNSEFDTEGKMLATGIGDSTLPVAGCYSLRMKRCMLGTSCADSSGKCSLKTAYPLRLELRWRTVCSKPDAAGKCVAGSSVIIDPVVTNDQPQTASFLHQKSFNLPNPATLNASFLSDALRESCESMTASGFAWNVEKMECEKSLKKLCEADLGLVWDEESQACVQSTIECSLDLCGDTARYCKGYRFSMPGVGCYCTGTQLDGKDVNGKACTGDVESVLVWNPARYDFKNIGEGKSSPAVRFTLTNNGNFAAKGCSPPSLIDNVNFKIVSDNCGGNDLDVNTSCEVYVRAVPSAVAPYKTTLKRFCVNGAFSATAATAIDGIKVNGVDATSANGNGAAGGNPACNIESGDLLDDDDSCSGFGGGTKLGLIWDATLRSLRLGNDGTCNGLNRKCVEGVKGVDASWVPQWSSIKGYWSCDESSGSVVSDSSSAGKNGTIQSATRVSSGVYDQGIALSGSSQWVSVPVNIDLLPELSVSLWFNIVDNTDQAMWSNDNGQFDRGLTIASGRLHIWCGNTACDTGITPPLNRWVHSTVVYSSTNTQLYLDGTLAWQRGSASSGYSGTDYVAIGRTNFGSGERYLKGIVDEVGIWGSVLSAADVQKIYTTQGGSGSSARSGQFTSRVLEGGSSAWKALSWMSTLPYGKPLPDAGATPTAPNPNVSASPAPTGSTQRLNSAWTPLWGNLVGYWTLDEVTTGSAPGGADFADLSGKGNHGFKVGAIQLGANAKVSKGIYNNGTIGSYVRIPHHSTLDMSSTISISFWINPESVDYRGFRVVDKGVEGSNGWLLDTYGGSSNFRFGGAAVYSNSYTVGSWQHVAVTLDSGVAKYYFNGELAGQGNAGSLYTTTQDLLLGGLKYIGAGSNSEFLRGTLDEVAIWNTALNQTQIQQIYQKQAGISASASTLGNGRIAWWKLDEPSGTVTAIADSSGNGGSATISGGIGFGAVGKTGTAASFQGAWNSRMSVGDANKYAFDRGDSFSMAAWIKTTSAGYIMGKFCTYCTSTYDTGYNFGTGADGALGLSLMNGHHNNNTIDVNTTAVNMIDGQWHHVAMTYNGNSSASGINLYVDGVLRPKTATRDSLSASFAVPAAFSIGNKGSDDSWQAPFNGLIDDAMIWNRVLTASEVAELAGGSTGGGSCSSVTDVTKSSGQMCGPCERCTYSGQEHETTVLGCSSGSNMTIESTRYYAPSTGGSVSCSSYVGSQCSAKSSCSVGWENGPCGGDPASGYYKTGEIIITCGGSGSAASSSETTAYYPAIEPNLMKDIVGLWHFDETTTGTAPSSNDFEDRSGNGHHLRTGGSFTLSEAGQFDTALRSTGSSWASTSGLLEFNGKSEMTFSFWAKIPSNSGAGPIFETNNNGPKNHLWLWPSGNSLWWNISDGYNVDGIEVDITSYKDGRWHHFVGVAKSATKKIYVDGQLMTPIGGTSGGSFGSGMQMNGGTFYVGIRPGEATMPTGMAIDELAIWSRGLSATEVLQVYRRGANRIKIQVRFCENIDCSDQEALPTKGWKGHKDSSTSYFTELLNKVGRLFSPGNPWLKFSDFAMLSGIQRPYMQYRMVLESDDTKQQCAYGTSANCSPEIKHVELVK